MKHKTWDFLCNSSNTWNCYNIVRIYNNNTRCFLFMCMFIFKVVVQLLFQLVHLSTQWTVVYSWTFPVSNQHNRLSSFTMSSLMFAAVSFLPEGTSTKPTGIGTLIGMGANVCIQCVSSSKTSSTVRATKRPLIRVDNLRPNSTNNSSHITQKCISLQSCIEHVDYLGKGLKSSEILIVLKMCSLKWNHVIMCKKYCNLT